jgi:hypothetical protein
VEEQQAEEAHKETTQSEEHTNAASGEDTHSTEEHSSSTETKDEKETETGETKGKPSYVQVAGANSAVTAKTALALMVGLVSAFVILA